MTQHETDVKAVLLYEGIWKNMSRDDEAIKSLKAGCAHLVSSEDPHWDKIRLVLDRLEKYEAALESIAGNMSLPQDTREYWRGKSTLHELVEDTRLAREALEEK